MKRIVLVRTDGPELEQIPVIDLGAEKRTVKIGSDAGCTIVLRHASIKPVHAEIEVDPEMESIRVHQRNGSLCWAKDRIVLKLPVFAYDGNNVGFGELGFRMELR